jgi:hypothetical protein
MNEELEQEYCVRCNAPICDDDPVPFCQNCYEEIHRLVTEK